MSLDSEPPSKTREDILEHRRRVRNEYRDLYDSVVALLFRHDPVGINFECNTDEYEPEVDTILPRLRDCQSAEDVNRVVHEEFTRWFGFTAGAQEKYAQIALEVWQLWQRFRQK